ncbi:MAG: Peptidoglycan glycosyltransferase [Parcubacteria group bacterium GW2011_GWA1_47_8]|nr:MAG: Peptidoglycan glycosyltransferase [Parcubacteria group bacterium GW2011_GWA1_47_8]
MKKVPLTNIWLINISMLIFTFILVGKLGYLQIVKGAEYREKVENQYSISSGVTLERGTIFFTEKSGRKISAATMTTDYTLALDPSQIGDPVKLADKIVPRGGFDRGDFIAKASLKNSRYTEIAKHVPEDVVMGIQALREKGVIIKKDKKRLYPGGRTAAQVLGFVGFQGDELRGQYGLERYYNDLLVRTGSDSSSSFFADLFLKAGQAIVLNRTREGDLVTSIEPSVEEFLERTLTDDVLKKYNAAGAMGIIMNPKNGEIYAMTGVPSFDPNNFSKEKNPATFSNPLVEGTYEMGSIIKTLTLSAGIDAGVITAKTTYDDTGSIILNTKRISNFDGKARGVVSMQEVLNQSLNMGSTFVAGRLGHDRFRAYFNAFGLSEETGIDLPNEAVGKTGNLSSPRDLDYATASFGQGIALTPIATIRAIAAVANGGVLVMPHVVKQTEYGFGVTTDFVPGSERRVIKKETSAEVSRMLTVAMDTALLEGTLKMEHYNIAIKTGTAQQVGKDGKYSTDDYLHTFVGYFPSYDPKFIVLLMVKNPRSERYASHTLSGPFMQIVKFLINYYEIPPDR